MYTSIYYLSSYPCGDGVVVAQLCRILCDLMGCSPPGSSVHGILQAGILEWVAIPFSRGSSWPRDWPWVSCLTGGFFTPEHQGSPHIYISLYACLHAKSLQSCLTLCDPMAYSLPGSSVHGDSPGKNTGVGCHVLLQVIFPTQGSNPGLPHCRQILNHLSHQGGPRILEWVAYPFSRGSSPPRNQTAVTCIAGGFFTSLATCISVYIYLICVLCSYLCIYVSIYQYITYYFYTHMHTCTY